MENKILTLKFSPVAWAKMQMACKLDKNECGFYGITSDDSILVVDDVFLPSQEVSETSVSFDDDSVSAYFEEYAQRGYPPRRLTSVWIHRHPNFSLSPSQTDEHSFNKIIGQQDVAVMAIFDAGEARAWLQINRVGRQELFYRIPLDCAVEYSRSFTFDADAFAQEFGQKVRHKQRFAACTGYAWKQQPMAATTTNPTGGLLFCDCCKMPLSHGSQAHECKLCDKQYSLCEFCTDKSDKKNPAVSRICSACSEKYGHTMRHCDYCRTPVCDDAARFTCKNCGKPFTVCSDCRLYSGIEENDSLNCFECEVYHE